jgi:hypothetical protein
MPEQFGHPLATLVIATRKSIWQQYEVWSFGMSAFDPAGEDHSDVDREIRIERMKREPDDLAGGSMISGAFGHVPPELEENFLTRVGEFEKAPWDTNFNRLVQRGVEMIPPPELDDRKLRVKLQEVLCALAAMRCFLRDTDHLSDRELYTWLWSDGLREETPDLSQLGGAWHTSPIGMVLTKTSPFSSNTMLARKNAAVGRQIFRSIPCHRIVLCLITGIGVCHERSNLIDFLAELASKVLGSGDVLLIRSLPFAHLLPSQA